MARDHYGLTRGDWALPQSHDDPPHYAEARALGQAQAEAIFAAAEEQRFKEDVQWLAELLAESRGDGLPTGSSVCDPAWKSDPLMRGIGV